MFIPMSFWFNSDSKTAIPLTCVLMYVKEKIKKSSSLIDILNDKTNLIYLINTFMNFHCINRIWRKYKHKLFIKKVLHKNKYQHVMNELYYKPNIGIGFYNSFESFNKKAKLES